VAAGEGASIGFGATGKGKAPSLLLVARVAGAAQAGPALAAGADAVVVPGGGLVERPAGATGLWGLALGDGPVDVEALRASEADFVLLEPGTAAEALQWEDAGFALAVDPRADDSTLRAVAALPVEAVVFDLPGDGPLTLARLLTVQRVALLTGKPALVAVGKGQGAEVARTLRDASVGGVVLDQPAESALKSWRETLDALPPRSKQRRPEAEASLPTPGRR
jgi:hypothetical protein